MLYSDGLTEARNEEGVFFDLPRARASVSANWQASCAEMHDALLDELRAFTGNTEQQDDITVVVVEYRP